ncbi:NACHT domain-containing protein [Caulobacter soli]|uniref:NACHT domain-containing protein n=1 Tax=Caulobacter soli TaxID=2708539 RepID=UPI0013ED3E45|nr:hypothetical protein [Caulobacter soli]
MRIDLDDDFIPLERTFHRLLQDETANDDTAVSILGRETQPLVWKDLLAAPRVILLSEAGSGKTAEARHVCRELRGQGKRAFFIRIEHVVQGFEDAFEEGTHAEFRAWTQAGTEGWLLLDSVDEARLKDPKDFERAVRKLGRELAPVLAQAHIVITGRAVAWRPKTDLMLVRGAFPYASPARAIETDADARAIKAETVETDQEGFMIVALDDLRGEQVDRFAAGKGVADITAFRAAVERKDAWDLTTRPMDLAELCAFWTDKGQIASRLALMRASIDRRLEERDQDRAEARPIPLERLRRGAKLVAAAATLTQEAALRVPDGTANTRGLPVNQVLADWDDGDIGVLLGRPIFDEGIYGTVRFHHRTVREYLTAEWLHDRIVDQASRMRIEALFFREQYGLEVIVPGTRPILPWLCLLDERILQRVTRLAPEVLFEGGDPSQLPRDTRVAILRQTCALIAQPAHGRSMMDISAVQRFAHRDLTDEIRSLLQRHAADENIAAFLLRMVWIGELADLAAEVTHLALTLRVHYPRIAAIRAVIAVASPAQVQGVREALLAEGDDVDRDWIGEFIPDLGVDADSAGWLLRAVAQAKPPSRYEVDTLTYALPDYLERLPLDQVAGWAAGLQALLATGPLTDRRYREISRRHAWLASTAARCVVRLIEARRPFARTEPCLWLLRTARETDLIDSSNLRSVRETLARLVPSWTELNRDLFWYDVTETRRRREDDNRLTDYFHVGVFGRDWRFSVEDFDAVVADVTGRPLLDDRLVALELAFALYRQGDRPDAWRRRLKQAVLGEMELQARLQQLLHPAKSEAARRWRRQEARWAKQNEAREAKQAAIRADWKTHLKAEVASIRKFELAPQISQSQWYLHDEVRGEGLSNTWSVRDWRSLAPEFGVEVARAFRDGAVDYWRVGRPSMKSQRPTGDGTPLTTIFGLTGLNIEALEQPAWLGALSSHEARLAARYAMNELNGFPPWLADLHAAFPGEVVEVVLGEIDFELATAGPDADSNYVLYDVAWHGHFLWDGLAAAFQARLAAGKFSPANLGHMLVVLNGANLGDATLAALAARKAGTTKHEVLAPMWFAMWCGVDPQAAIPALAARLSALKTPQLRTQFAMRFLSNLIGERSLGLPFARQAYRTIAHMKTLHLLMHAYIRREDDIERAGKGVYSPGLRDDAQRAREALMAFIAETPGKEAFLALMDIALEHPDEEARPWAVYRARAKAQRDADPGPWSPVQVRDFNEKLERTPANHRELWDLAVERLFDLKNDLEGGDESLAPILRRADEETEVRNFIGGLCRSRSAGRYAIPQEEELADAKRPDLRFHGVGFDGPVPVELKLADNWSGPQLFERLENQLCGDYLRDVRSGRGIYVLVWSGEKAGWDHPAGGRLAGLDALVAALKDHWLALSERLPNVEDIAIIGVDLTRRARPALPAASATAGAAS